MTRTIYLISRNTGELSDGTQTTIPIAAFATEAQARAALPMFGRVNPHAALDVVEVPLLPSADADDYAASDENEANVAYGRRRLADSLAAYKGKRYSVLNPDGTVLASYDKIADAAAKTYGERTLLDNWRNRNPRRIETAPRSGKRYDVLNAEGEVLESFPSLALAEDLAAGASRSTGRGRVVRDNWLGGEVT